MPERSNKKLKRPRDVNQRAKLIVEIATGQTGESEGEAPEKDPAAVSLGRRGGLKGGPARAAKLSAKKRSQIARKAAEARWSKNER